MKQSWRFSRRSLGLLAATWLLDRCVGRLFARDADSSEDRAGRTRMRSRRYVVNATVVLGSIPIFTKTKAGGALLTIEQAGAAGCGQTGLQFGAGSWPEHLKGFNRFGITQEIVRTDYGAIVETSYMSFMTSSREANFAEAEKAFQNAVESLPVTVSSGRCSANSFSERMLHEAVAAGFNWKNSPELLDELRANINLAGGSVPRTDAGCVLPTFLYAVRDALLKKQMETGAVYAHNGKIYRLTTEMRRDSRSGRLIVTGRTSQPGVRGGSEFKLWIDPEADPDLPHRIEFRARNYLRLILESDETQCEPVFRPLLEEVGQ